MFKENKLPNDGLFSSHVLNLHTTAIKDVIIALTK